MSIRSLIPSLWVNHNEKDVFQNLQQEVDRVFHQFRQITPSNPGESGNPAELGHLIPKINIAESEKQYEIEVELPGVDQDNVEVTVRNQTLIIEGHKKSETTEKKKDYRIVERTSGSFKRVIPLGFDVEDKEVNAEFKDGVLTVVVNKPEELATKGRKIEIKSAESA